MNNNRWRVECPTPGNTAWVVRSPRGVVVFRTENHAAALQLARTLAGVDTMLGAFHGTGDARLNPSNVVPLRPR